jgi:hypothetical protein
MLQNNGSFANIIYDGNKITLEAEPDSLGDVSVTATLGRIQCFWDGAQWVCNSILFSQGGGQSQNQGQTFGITHSGNKITIEAEPDTLGDVHVTAALGSTECFWDGAQWVCNDVGFSLRADAAKP